VLILPGARTGAQEGRNGDRSLRAGPGFESRSARRDLSQTVSNTLASLSGIVVLGTAAQWVAARLRIPSILLLLTFGLVAGPVTGWLQLDQLFKDLLLPFVSLSVAVILFEGGLSLRFRELRGVSWVFIQLTTIGVLVTWAISAAAARLLLGFDWGLAALLGAILVVTGPTVIGPLLRHLRLSGPAAAILKWEGIVIDPVGAVLAVLVFTALKAGGFHEATTQVAIDLGRTALVGVGLGAIAGAALLWPLRRFWIPDTLQNPVTLAAVFGTFTLANLIQPESGLLVVTVMGIAVANQRSVTVKHLMEFKESLSVLLISSLFIILAARLRREDLLGLDGWDLAFVGVLVLAARPAAVLASTLGSAVGWRDRVLLAWMAPRGIVAAAVASVFALELSHAGYPLAERLPALVFLVIVCTVLLYGLTAAPLARRLGLARPDPQGVLFLGAHGWVRALALALQEQGCPVLLIDTNWTNISAARLAGLPTYFGSILAERTREEVELGEMGRLLALTGNDEVNSLACLRYIEVFGRGEVYQLPFDAPAEGRREAVPLEQRGRLLFGPEITFSNLTDRFWEDPVAKATLLTEEFDFEAFKEMHGESVLPVLLIREGGKVVPFTVEEPPTPKPGQTVISLAPRPKEKAPREVAVRKTEEQSGKS
jgi:NhaP-type Na+/H+ or K+/H+ antiporter/Trk K+ transport system NAD-binding subunit